MAITLISTAGATNANSFVSLEEANEYLNAHVEFPAWVSLDDEDKKRNLITATRTLDLLIYSGRKSTTTQALTWPRTGVYDYDGNSLQGVPKLLKEAVCELVIHWLTEDDNLAGDFELENLESVEIGPIKYKVRSGAYSDLPGDVTDRFKAMGPGVVLDGSGVERTAKVMVI